LHHAGAIKIRIANKNKSTFPHQDTNKEANLHGACGDKPVQESMGSADSQKFVSMRTSRTPRAKITQMNERRLLTARRPREAKHPCCVNALQFGARQLSIA
jgi:hypothetical protein